MWNYRKPIIAQVHGYCLAGGLDLIGTCDIVWAAEGTRFGHPAARALGIPPTLGMLPLKIGAAATKELLFTGDLIDADEALRLGMVSHVVPADELDDAVDGVLPAGGDDADGRPHGAQARREPLAGAPGAAHRRARGRRLRRDLPPDRSFAEFGRISREEGLRAALAWRDVPFAEGPAADHDAATAAAEGVPTAAGRRPVRILHTSDLHLGEAAAADGRHDAAVDASSSWRPSGPSTSCCWSATSSTRTGCRPASPDALVDALDRLDVPVVVLPGNHDTLVPGCVWERLDLPDHVRVLRDPAAGGSRCPSSGSSCGAGPT